MIQFASGIHSSSYAITNIGALTMVAVSLGLIICVAITIVQRLRLNHRALKRRK